MDKYLKVSFIIPSPPGESIEKVLNAIKELDYPQKLVEIFASYGKNPSSQRNEAVKYSKGELLYFLDNDSEIKKDALKKIVAIFRGDKVGRGEIKSRGFSIFPQSLSNLIINNFFSGKIYNAEIGVVGGPNVWEKKESFWAFVSSSVLESFFAHFFMAARYRSIGPIHRASEKELILCNLAVKRDVFEKVGGFNEVLYPNEENELLNRIEQTGFQLVYHPGVLVFRPRRETLISLLRAVFHYGRGRMEQVRIEGVFRNFLQISPLILLLYLTGLLFLLFLGTNNFFWILLPFLSYLLLAIVSAVGFAQRKKENYLIIILPIVYFIFHLTYAWGLVYGLMTDLKKRKKKKEKEKINIIKIKGFEIGWEKSLIL